jgi:hypothetical protein
MTFPKKCLTALGVVIYLKQDFGKTKLLRISCKKLSRLEIIYSTVARLIKAIAQNDIKIPENFKPYLEENHYNDTIYRLKDKDLNSKIRKVWKDALKLHSLYRNN